MKIKQKGRHIMALSDTIEFWQNKPITGKIGGEFHCKKCGLVSVSSETDTLKTGLCISCYYIVIKQYDNAKIALKQKHQKVDLGSGKIAFRDKMSAMFAFLKNADKTSTKSLWTLEQESKFKIR